MAANHKLTATIAGRVIEDASASAAAVILTFDDGSVMKIKVSSATRSFKAPSRAAITKTRQQGTKLDFDLADGSTFSLETAEPTSSVMLRDKTGAMEYAD